jgi:hypothetical protein
MILKLKFEVLKTLLNDFLSHGDVSVLLHEGDTGLKTPCEVLVGLPARDFHSHRKHARTFCQFFMSITLQGDWSVLYFTCETQG